MKPELKLETETMRTLSCAAILFDLDGVLVESRLVAIHLELLVPGQ